MRTALLLVFSVFTLSGVPAGADDAALDAAKREIRAIRDADVVVLARVVEVHRGPEIWCGIAVTRQEVSWRVDEVISSSLPADAATGGAAAQPRTVPGAGDVVRVGHLLVGGGIVHRDYPTIRDDLVHPGARAILLLNETIRRSGKGGPERIAWNVRDESLGVRLLDPPLAADTDRGAILRALLDLPALAPYLHPEIADRKPVRFALSDALPNPVPGLRKFDLPVLFFPEGELRKDPFLELTALTVEGDRARIEFRYDAEGVRGSATLARRNGSFRVLEANLSER